jgi:phosphoglycerol transferase MdoB-like AlkP superfamily enzyme
VAVDSWADDLTADDAPEPGPGDGAAGDEVGDRPAAETAGSRRKLRRVAAGVTTALAGLLVFFALVAPNQIGQLTPGAFVRIPAEALLAVALLLVLPPRGRRVVAVVIGVVLGLLTIVKVLDMGFYAVLNRPVNPVLDGILVGAAVDFLTASYGRAGAIGTVVFVVAVVVALLVFMTLSVRRLSRLVVRHRRGAIRVTTVLIAVWVACALLGVQIVPGVSVAANSAAALVYDQALQVRAGVRDLPAFAAQAADDPFHATPGSQLLTGLRGKDVIFTVVESYGRSAVQDPQVDAVLDAGTRQLRASGYASRSAFLTSPVFGAGSWLAHGTFFSGLEISNQQRYDTLVASNRLTLTKAFQRAGWRTVAVMPGTTSPWSEGDFYGLDRVYDFQHLDYHGPSFSWATMPDQYTFSAFQRMEYAKPNRGPLLAEIVTVSSHAPWEPQPRFIPWGEVGDGSIFNTQGAKGDQPEAILKMDPKQVRANYVQSIGYSLNTLISYVQTYGNDNLVMVFFGDHQPSPIVTGDGAPHDVPVTVVARDRAVLDRISGWGWVDGLRPDAQAPVWPMAAFRDRFLTAFGPQAQPGPSASPSR